MKKLQNDKLQITGIIVSIVAIAAIVQPLIKMAFGSPLTFMMFGIVPDGVPALVAWTVVLIVGLVVVSVTKPLKN